MKTYVQTKTCTQMFIADLLIIAPNLKEPRCSPTGEWLSKSYFYHNYYVLFFKNTWKSHHSGQLWLLPLQISVCFQKFSFSPRNNSQKETISPREWYHRFMVWCQRRQWLENSPSACEWLSSPIASSPHYLENLYPNGIVVPMPL
jgi:hypothetical protein